MLVARAILALCAAALLVGGPVAARVAWTLRQDGRTFFERPGGAAVLQRATDLSLRLADAGGCGADVCFALDGSRSLSARDFQAQTEFAQLVAIVVSSEDRFARFSAVQYGAVAQEISNVTRDADVFLRRVFEARFARADRSFLNAGILFCAVQLRDTPPPRRPRIVLVGDGEANRGGDVEDVTAQFVPPRGNGAIVAVGVGVENRTALRQIAGRNGVVASIAQNSSLPDALQTTVEFLCEL